jgi:hypothetical protein
VLHTRWVRLHAHAHANAPRHAHARIQACARPHHAHTQTCNTYRFSTAVMSITFYVHCQSYYTSWFLDNRVITYTTVYECEHGNFVDLWYAVDILETCFRRVWYILWLRVCVRRSDSEVVLQSAEVTLKFVSGIWGFFFLLLHLPSCSASALCLQCDLKRWQMRRDVFARGKWRTYCTYGIVCRSFLSYGTSDFVWIIRFEDRWR